MKTIRILELLVFSEVIYPVSIETTNHGLYLKISVFPIVLSKSISMKIKASKKMKRKIISEFPPKHTLLLTETRN